MEDRVFGEMTFDYGWTKKESIIVFSKEHQVSCIASAYTGKGIEDVQREQYSYYLKEKNSIIMRIEDAIKEYCKKRSIEYSEEIGEHVKPTELVFQKNGKAGLIFDCDWDKETGIVVLFCPEISVESPDDFL